MRLTYLLFPLLFYSYYGAYSLKLAGRGVAIFTLIGLLLIVSMNIWDDTILTLALVLTSTFIALLIGIPWEFWLRVMNLRRALYVLSLILCRRCLFLYIFAGGNVF